MFTVIIRYWSGVEETLPGIDEENARAYLAEAGVSVRVKAAEMRADDGSLASGFQRLRNPAATASVG